MNLRQIKLGKSVGVTLCNEEEASVSQQTLLKVKVIRPPSQATITTLESDSYSHNLWVNIKNSVGWGTSGLVHIGNKKNFEQPGLVSWRLQLKKKPPLDHHTGGARKHTGTSPTLHIKMEKRNESDGILCDESTNEGGTLAGEDGSTASSEPAFCLFFCYALHTLFHAEQSYHLHTLLPFLHQNWASTLHPGLIYSSPVFPK